MPAFSTNVGFGNGGTGANTGAVAYPAHATVAHPTATSSSPAVPLRQTDALSRA